MVGIGGVCFTPGSGGVGGLDYRTQKCAVRIMLLWLDTMFVSLFWGER